MEETGAVVLDNFFPEPDAIRWRHGSQIFATTPETTAVETMMVWQGGVANNIFACVGGKIYDVTAGGTISSPLVTGLSNNRWQSITFSTPGGQFLVAVNGQDALRNFNGTAWSTTPAITGPSNPNALINVWSFKQRLFFVESGTANAWYLAPNAIGGAATQLPLGSLLTKGGYLMAGATWTRDSGYGPQDYCVFISSEGEVLVYAGTDPSQVTTWSKVGQFLIGRPIGRRCWLNVASDLVINCSDGLMPLSKAIQYDRAAAAQAAFTWNIQKAFNSAYTSYGANFGWQIIGYPKANMAIINIPVASGLTSYQYVMNVLTGAWARFTGMNASSWVVRQDDLFFGDMQGRVLTAESGSADINQAISAVWVSAFNDLGRPGLQKNVRLARPIFITDPGVNAAIGVCADYNVVTPTIVQGTQSATGNSAVWDQGLWDQSLWAPDNTTRADWVNASGEGYQIAGAVGINMLSATPATAINCKIASMTILYEPGGYI
ncbi:MULTISPECIES: hypothetical protein [unclassified Mesorhizobium]|uniref:hypothetical protein n=1 Tax=unclassified Mesorhizobium TaxID=325217 RepID=UPI000FCA252C|nr:MULTISPECIES: hypothetical protein [unclassified Mesorhizobium]RUV16957.1 hypothetical protein EOA91_19570 [Mesorhizobium sp. M1A.F.Ca.IN.022.04.1.1]RWG29738.1 MAG: hypothetical protein EOQ60_20375 [Mesorhizobium sp.]